MKWMSYASCLCPSVGQGATTRWRDRKGWEAGDIDALWSHTVARTGRTSTLALFGGLDMRGAVALGDLFLRELHRLDMTNVTVDLAAVTFLDAAGLTALVVGYNQAQASGRTFTVVRAHGPARRVLQVAGLVAHFCDQSTRLAPEQNRDPQTDAP